MTTPTTYDYTHLTDQELESLRHRIQTGQLDDDGHNKERLEAIRKELEKR